MTEAEYYLKVKFIGNEGKLFSLIKFAPQDSVDILNCFEFSDTVVKLDPIGVAIMSSCFEVLVAKQSQLWVPLSTDSGNYLHCVNFGLTMSSPEFTTFNEASSLGMRMIAVLKGLVQESIPNEAMSKIIHDVVPDEKGVSIVHRYGGGWLSTRKKEKISSDYPFSQLLGATQPVDEGKCKP